MGFGASAFVLSAGAALRPAKATSATGLEFTPVAANGLDTITLPEGFGWQVVARWGDPLWSDGAPFDHATRGTGASQERAFGDNCDGMALFAREGRSVLAVNNEHTNLGIAFANRVSGRPETEDDVRKSKATHGVSVVEIAQTDGAWGIVQDSPYNRRITPDTPTAITGPARGHAMMQTAADPEGTHRARHLEQLRQRAHALGHLPRLRGELQRLLLVERSRPRAARWRSTRSTPRPCRRSAPRSAASSTRTRR